MAKDKGTVSANFPIKSSKKTSSCCSLQPPIEDMWEVWQPCKGRRLCKEPKGLWRSSKRKPATYPRSKMLDSITECFFFLRNTSVVFLLCCSFYDAAVYFPRQVTLQKPPKVTSFKFSVWNLLIVGWFLGWMGFGVLFPFLLLLFFGRQEDI